MVLGQLHSSKMNKLFGNFDRDISKACVDVSPCDICWKFHSKRYW